MKNIYFFFLYNNLSMINYSGGSLPKTDKRNNK